MKHAREEHRAAIEWLNSHTDDDVGFFLCEIHIYKIAESKPAVKFEVIEKPNDWAKLVKKSDAINQTEQFRLEYWTAFNDYAFANAQYSKAFNRRKAPKSHWMDLSIGSSSCHIVVSLVRKYDSLVVELYISDDKDLFHSLIGRREQIEKEIGYSLDWRELPGKKASRIKLAKRVDFEDRSKWAGQFDWLIDVILKYKRAFKKFV